MSLRWRTLEDDVHFREMARFRERAFFVSEVTDMDDACGRDNEGRPQFHLDLSFIDLDQMPPPTLQSALQSCGWEGVDYRDPWVMADICVGAGHKAPLYKDDGRGQIVLRRLGRQQANQFVYDPIGLYIQLGKVVNQAGSTALEYMRGDFFSGMIRGAEQGKHDSRLLLKMYGVSDDRLDQIADSRPADWMPYFAGYMDGVNGNPPPPEARGKRGRKKVSPSYFQGYDRGKLVKEGKAVAPSWITHRM